MTKYVIKNKVTGLYFWHAPFNIHDFGWVASASEAVSYKSATQAAIAALSISGKHGSYEVIPI